MRIRVQRRDHVVVIFVAWGKSVSRTLKIFQSALRAGWLVGLGVLAAWVAEWIRP